VSILGPADRAQGGHAAIDCDVAVVATPIDRRHLIHIPKPSVLVIYSLREIPTSPTLEDGSS
jgi:hypothetical protein